MERDGFEVPVVILEQIKRELPRNFTGKIELNCYEGGVGNVNYLWSRKGPNNAKPLKASG